METDIEKVKKCNVSLDRLITVLAVNTHSLEVVKVQGLTYEYNGVQANDLSLHIVLKGTDPGVLDDLGTTIDIMEVIFRHINKQADKGNTVRFYTNPGFNRVHKPSDIVLYAPSISFTVQGVIPTELIEHVIELAVLSRSVFSLEVGADLYTYDKENGWTKE